MKDIYCSLNQCIIYSAKKKTNDKLIYFYYLRVKSKTSDTMTKYCQKIKLYTYISEAMEKHSGKTRILNMM